MRSSVLRIRRLLPFSYDRLTRSELESAEMALIILVDHYSRVGICVRGRHLTSRIVADIRFDEFCRDVLERQTFHGWTWAFVT